MNEKDLSSCILKILPSNKAEQAQGTGFWVALDGYVLTCSHVVNDIETPWVEYKGERAPAKVVDQEGDITLLKVDRLAGPVAPLGKDWQPDDELYSVGYQYERPHGRVSFFPMKGTALGPTEVDGIEAIALVDAIHVKPGASGAPALNRRIGRIVGIISDKWEEQQVAFVLLLSSILDRWKILAPRFQPVDYGQEDIFRSYDIFVGREREIKDIREFLQREGGDYLLIQGDVGMGKTALIAEMAQIVARGDLDSEVSCLVFFIRQEEGRNTPEKFLYALNRQLLDLLGEREEIPVTLPDRERQYQRLWGKATSMASAQNRLLVLIDGLDECALEGKNPLAEYLPPLLASFTYWVLTSRPFPEALSTIPTTHSLGQACSLWLGGLGPEEIRELLRRSGDKIERSDAFIQKVLEHTNGEPLFLRFLCQDIAGWGEEAEKHLEETPKKVSEYFRRQFELLRDRITEALPYDILKTLLVAHSGLTAHEIAGILDVPLFAVRKGLGTIERFLLRNKHYKLMHLEFRRTLEEELVRRKEKQKALEKLLVYCTEQWQKDDPNETYALRFYLRHLYELECYDKMFGLCKAGYLETKIGRLISPELLEEDYHFLYQACEKTGNLEELLRWGEHRARISDEVTVLRDIESMPRAIGKLAKKGRRDWWERGVGLCALVPGITGKIKCFISLCEGLKPSKEEVLEEVFERIQDLLKQMPGGIIRSDLIVQFSIILCSYGEPYLDRALQAADQIGDERDRSWALSLLAGGYAKLQDVDKASKVLDRALQAADQIGDEEDRSRALSLLAEGYAKLQDVDKASKVLDRALQAADQIGLEEHRSWALSSVAEGYAKLMKVAETSDLLFRISEDRHFLKACEAIFQAAGEISGDKAKIFPLSILYRILPLASQRSRRVYFRVASQSIPLLTPHLPPEQIRPILAFLEERIIGGK